MYQNIERTIISILSNYGNTAYLNKTKSHSFDDVRGTRLWKLWYGESFSDFCVRTLEDKFKKCKQNALYLSEFTSNLQALESSLQEEFNNLSVLHECK